MGSRGHCHLRASTCFLLLIVTVSWSHPLSKRKPQSQLPIGSVEDTTPSSGFIDPDSFSESEVSENSKTAISDPPATKSLSPVLASHLYPQARGGEEDIIWIVTTKRPDVDYEKLKKTHSDKVFSSSTESTSDVIAESTRSSLLNSYVTQPSVVLHVTKESAYDLTTKNVFNEVLPTNYPNLILESGNDGASIGVDTYNNLVSDGFGTSQITSAFEFSNPSPLSTESSRTEDEIQVKWEIASEKPVINIDNFHLNGEGLEPEALGLEDYYDLVQGLMRIAEPITVTYEGVTSYAPLNLQEELGTLPFDFTTTANVPIDSSYDRDDLSHKPMDGNTWSLLKTLPDTDQSLVYQSNNEKYGKPYVLSSIKNESSYPLSFGERWIPLYLNSSKPVQLLVASLLPVNLNELLIPVSVSLDSEGRESIRKPYFADIDTLHDVAGSLGNKIDTEYSSTNDRHNYLNMLSNGKPENSLNRQSRSSKIVDAQTPLWMVGHLVLSRNDSNVTLAPLAKKKYSDKIAYLDEPQFVSPPSPNMPLNLAQIRRLIFPPAAGLEDQSYAEALLRRTHNLLYKIWTTSNNKVNKRPTSGNSQVRLIKPRDKYNKVQIQLSMDGKPRNKYNRAQRQATVDGDRSDSNALGIIGKEYRDNLNLIYVLDASQQGDDTAASHRRSVFLDPPLTTHSQTPFALRGNILELLPVELPQINPILPPDVDQTDLPVDLRPIVSALPSAAQLRGELQSFSKGHGVTLTN